MLIISSMQVDWYMVGKTSPPQAEGGAAGDPYTCTNRLASEELSSETEACSAYSKTWATLVEECVPDQIPHFPSPVPAITWLSIVI